ncbi:MAG: SusC/RagA family TonB-linked outer membrane protein [Dysgonamonadaceae bacterium]|jgi:TonB-linked SusC/RagA family outer membrane protein|nr:SusC/RagA family TonB-linked outer membrane protein [Dysgonamonadaceae bacterium]
MKIIVNLTIMLLLAFMIMPVAAENSSVQQQSKTVTGTVVDENDEPVVGARVFIPGASIGTTTNLEGKFSINIPVDKKSFQITYLGYKNQTLSLSAGNYFTVKLVPVNIELEEVVVVGYGNQKLKNVTGAITTVNPEQFKDLPYGNLGAMLQGEIAGLRVNGGQTRPQSQASLIIRNPFTLSKDGGTTDPIYIVDDIIVSSGAFNNIDPNEIEQISIVKDGAAAVYGARGSQGAVLVKTKRGKEGQTRVSYSGQFGYNDEMARPKVMSAYEYGLFWNRYTGANGNSTISNPKTGLFQADELEAMKGMNYDWLDEAWKAASSMKHNINLSGGMKNATFFGSVSYFTQTGNLGRLDYDKWNYRVGADVKMASHFKVSFQASGDYETTVKTFNKVGGENDENDYNSLLFTPKYIPHHLDGLPLLRYGVSNSQRNAVQQYNFFELEKRGDIVETLPQSMRINGAIEYDFDWSKIFKGLRVKLNYSKGISTTKSSQFGSKYTGYYFGTRGGSGNHLYIGEDLLNTTNLKTVQVNNGNRLLRDMTRNDDYQLNFTANYARSFGLHNVSGLFSVEKRETDNSSTRFMREDPLDYTLFNGEYNTATGTIDGTTGRQVSGDMSYIGRLNYSYNDRYLLEFLIRSDASTKFSPENYWGIFPSLSAGWVISEESWFKDKESLSWLNYLKIRASYGILGKDNTKAWLWRQRYTYQANKGAVFGTNAGANVGWGLKMEAAPNFNAHWDKNYKHNIGLDTRYLNGRLSVSIDAYLDKNREMLVQREASVPVTVGGALAAENYDEIDAYGVELSLGWRGKISEFSYNINVNSGWNDSRYIKKDWPAILAYNSVYPGGPTDMGTWGYDYMGMFRTQADIDNYFAEYNITSYLNMTQQQVKPGMLIYRDIRGPQREDGTYEGPDGIVDGKDQIQLAKRSSSPYGFNLRLGGDWKGLSFSASFGASWGGFSVLPGRSVSNLEYNNVAIFWNDMFTPEDILDSNGNVVASANINAKYPNVNLSGTTADSRFWEVNSFRMNLRILTLGYSLPKKVANQLHIESCRLNLTGTNLLSLYNPYPEHFTDPQVGFSSYPVLRTFSLGVNIGF